LLRLRGVIVVGNQEGHGHTPSVLYMRQGVT
jgi:hypothetical protein